MTSLDDTWFTTPDGEGGMGFREEPPHEVGGWRLHGEVGRGGFGRVFLAYKGERRGALKVLRPDYVARSDAEAFRQSFESEADILSQLRGPHTAELIEADLSGYAPWLVTRFVPGDTLAYQVKFENPVRGHRWWDLAFGLFSGLVEAHGKGIIHRDIKPSNVMRSADVAAVIIDFGIALMASTTNSWNRAGTDLFQSPEQRRGEALTPASDVYSAALTLLYVTTKPTSPLRDTFTKHDAPGVPFVDDVFDPQSSEAEFLRLALSLNPSKRPTAAELLELCLFHSRVEDLKTFRGLRGPAAPMALPDKPMSSDETILALALPTSSARRPPVQRVSWGQVEETISRLLSIQPGQSAEFGWFGDDIEVSVFGLHTPHILVEFRAPGHHDDVMLEKMLRRGWAPPENPREGSWLLILPGSRKAAAQIVSELTAVVRDVVGIEASRPERVQE